MDIEYDWRSSLPEQQLRIHMQNWRKIRGSEQIKEFDATLVLEREEITSSKLRMLLVQYPLMTMKVIAAIYWEAIKLWWKKIPIYDHPNKHTNNNNVSL
jgi:DUF1365 family protein